MTVLLVPILWSLVVTSFAYDYERYKTPTQYLSEGATVLNAEDFERAKHANVSADYDDSKLYRSDLFEGDVAFKLNEIGKDGKFRNALRDRSKRWPGKQIPYEMDSSFNSEARTAIAQAISDIESKTCIRFVTRQRSDKNFLHLYNYDGCWTYAGVSGGMQPVHLGEGCNYKGTVTHELMHTIGFLHEQARNDRDDYIEVLFRNINPGDESQFTKESLGKIDHLNTEYDYESVMHYSKRAFSRNGQPTIRVLKGNHDIGFKQHLSANDALKINRLYECTENPASECQDVLTCKRVVSMGKCNVSSLNRKCAKSCGKC